MLKRAPLFIVTLVLACLLARYITYQLVANSLLVFRQDGSSRAQAVQYAPDDPATHAAYGKYLLYRADEPQAAAGLVALQHAAALTPNDYRYQLELGRAAAVNQQTAGAEAAFQRAIQLAPRHFETHWTYANFALRAGQREAALAAFQQALALSGLDHAYRAEVERTAAHNAYAALVGAYGFDLAALERITPATPPAQMHLVSFLAQPASLDLALTKWRTLPAIKANLTVGEAALYRNLLFKLLVETQQAGRWPAARAIWQGLLASEGEPASSEVNWLTNGGFERVPLNERYAELAQGFDWQIEGHAEIAADRTELAAHTGGYALRLRVVARPATTFQHVAQRVIVTPGATYRLRYWVKANELPSATPYFEITDAPTPAPRPATTPALFSLRANLPRDTTDWQEQTLRFTVPAATHVIVLRLCVPLTGTLDLNRRNTAWLDDVSLQQEEALAQ